MYLTSHDPLTLSESHLRVSSPMMKLVNQFLLQLVIDENLIFSFPSIIARDPFFTKTWSIMKQTVMVLNDL
jgi:hypothetical protein